MKKNSVNNEAGGLSLSFPGEGFSEEAMANLKNLIASKQTLIRKALHADRLDVEMNDGKITFAWWDSVGTAEQIKAYTDFLAALQKRAKEAKRITAKEKDVESEKYTFRVFLIRLGLGGEKYKETRKLLMEPLTGHAAFKNQDAADAFYGKLKEKRVKAKQGQPEAEENDQPKTVENDQEVSSDEISE